MSRPPDTIESIKARKYECFIKAYVDPRDPEPTRVGIFRYHNCWKCKDGTRLDLRPTPERPGNCGHPHARND